MAKMETITDEQQALAAIGLSDDTSTPDDVPVTTEKEEVTTSPETEEPVTEKEPDKSGEMTEEQRRTWQGEADKAKSERDAAKREAEFWKQQVGDISRTLKSNQESLIDILKPKEAEPPPKKFINEEGYWDQHAFDEWSKHHDEQLVKEVVRQSKETISKEQERETFMGQVSQLCEKYPEYRLPTGEPDFDRIDRELKEITSKKTLVSLFDERHGVSDSKMVEKIEKNAQKPSSVVNSQETSNEPEEPDEDDKFFRKVFGETL